MWIMSTESVTYVSSACRHYHGQISVHSSLHIETLLEPDLMPLLELLIYVSFALLILYFHLHDLLILYSHCNRARNYFRIENISQRRTAITSVSHFRVPKCTNASNANQQNGIHTT